MSDTIDKTGQIRTDDPLPAIPETPKVGQYAAFTNEKLGRLAGLVVDIFMQDQVKTAQVIVPFLAKQNHIWPPNAEFWSHTSEHRHLTCVRSFFLPLSSCTLV